MYGQAADYAYDGYDISIMSYDDSADASYRYLEDLAYYATLSASLIPAELSYMEEMARMPDCKYFPVMVAQESDIRRLVPYWHQKGFHYLADIAEKYSN